MVNRDGTVTPTGKDMWVCTSHSSVLLKDVGYLAIVDTQGPHQFAGDFSAYCDAITAAIG